MKKAILIATLAIVFVAGCTQPNLTQIFQQTTNTAIAGTGIVMTDFTPDQTTLYGLQSDRVVMTVSNKGGHSVPFSEGLVYLTGQALQKNTGNNQIYWNTADNLVLPIKTSGDFKPADTVTDTPGDEKTVTWTLTAPNISKGQQTNYLFIGRTYYKYQTKVDGNIWVYSDTEADAAKSASRSLNKATWSATSGPVAINVRVTQDPVVLYGTESTFTMVIKISNVGGGVLYQKDAITGDYSQKTTGDQLALTSAQINRVDVDVLAAGSSIGGTDCVGPFELVGGKDLTLSCDVSVPGGKPQTFTSLPITVTADYGYYTERTASVTVSGR